MKLPGDLRIRAARLDEVEALVQLERNLDTLPHWPAAAYRAAITDPNALRCLFVAEVGGEMVGFAVGRLDRIADECTGELESVGVEASARRCGVGRELCRSVIAWCRSCGASHLDLEVRSQSVGPIALYEEIGFVVTGMRRGYYRNPEDDAVLMRLQFSGDGLLD